MINEKGPGAAVTASEAKGKVHIDYSPIRSTIKSAIVDAGSRWMFLARVADWLIARLRLRGA